MASGPSAPTITAPATGEVRPAEIASDWGELLLVATVVMVEVPVAKLTVRELFRLHAGSVVAASQLSGAHVPVVVGGKVFAWGEFQVVGEHLALRIAELA
jgi:flagellar motor switch/type III secretory pathway protein FliN